LHDELGREPVFDRPVQYRGKSLLVTARRMEQFGERSGTFYNFRDITYLSRLERRIDERTRDSGFVARYCFDDMVTESSSMQACIALARRFAGADFPVLIHGESGTGKELLSHSLHSASARARGPFVAFNCAAMPESLIESELFGYEAGSFTGALKSGKPGLFEQADKGTIFLDEIGDMPVSLQSRLLRVLQERVVMRLGSKHLTAVDIRVIAATNQDLEERMAQGSFRPDLYYRLNVLPLPVPPLRERVRDIVLLLQSFLATVGKGNLHLEPETAALLERYSWPCNIREL
jgi:transcriptional regulator with PAS, ATPase and Fis domain